MRTAHRRVGVLTVLALIVALSPAAYAHARAGACTTRTLVESAYPSEADAVLTHVVLDKIPAMVLGGHHYYLGSIEGKPVVTTMTGIGFVNARDTTKKAVDGFTCRANRMVIGAVVFSGVAGGAGRTQIADVAAPARWTVNDAKSWMPVDASMLAAARLIKPAFKSTDTAGDPLCTCQDPDLVPLVDLKRKPSLVVGGDGSSADVNAHDTAQLCQPGGGDVFGCEPCHAPDRGLIDPVAVASTAPGFFANLIRSNSGGTTSASGHTYDAVDEETAAVQQVARAHRLAFLGFRGMSDGPGDPLNLPGFPFQFFLYKQIAAENAAIATAAFLKVWRGPELAT